MQIGQLQCHVGTLPRHLQMRRTCPIPQKGPIPIRSSMPDQQSADGTHTSASAVLMIHQQVTKNSSFQTEGAACPCHAGRPCLGPMQKGWRTVAASGPTGGPATPSAPPLPPDMRSGERVRYPEVGAPRTCLNGPSWVTSERVQPLQASSSTQGASMCVVCSI